MRQNLAGIFQNIRNQRLDLSNTLLVTPTFDIGPQIEGGMLRMRGCISIAADRRSVRPAVSACRRPVGIVRDSDSTGPKCCSRATTAPLVGVWAARTRRGLISVIAAL
jgi:hypothetical protein